MGTKLRVSIYVGLGVLALALLDPRTRSDESYGAGDDGGVILGFQFVAGVLEAALVLAVVVLIVELTIRHRARRRLRQVAAEQRHRGATHAS